MGIIIYSWWLKTYGVSVLENKKVNEVMTKNVFTTTTDEDVVFAFEKLMKHKISALPVINDFGEIVGIVTATDLGHNLILDNYQLGTKIVNVMVKKVVSIDSEASLYDAISLMNDNSLDGTIVNQLPVIEDSILIGIISDGDIIKALL